MARQFAGIASVVLALLTLILGIVGWWGVLESDHSRTATLDQALFLTIKAFTFSDDYNYLEAFGDPLSLHIARWTGLAATSSALIRIGYTLLGTEFKNFRASFRRGHAVVIGDHPYARRFAEVFASHDQQVTHHATADENEWDGVLTLRRPVSLNQSLLRRSLSNAKRIIVAEQTDAATAQTALLLARDYPDTSIFAFIKQPWLAERLNHVSDISAEHREKGDRLTVISEAALAARAIIARHPLFIEKDGKARDSLHVLIAGFGALGEAVAIETIMTSVVNPTKLPMITILDPRADERESGFVSRHGDLSDLIDIKFINCRADALSKAAMGSLKKRSRTYPINGVYVCPGEAHTPLIPALALREIGEREGLFDCPFFVRARDGAGLPESRALDETAIRPLMPFAGWSDIIETSCVLEEDPEWRARSFHNQHRNKSSASASNQAWEHLAENYRVSNRRSVAHVPAKLVASGFNIRTWAQNRPLSPNAIPKLASGEKLYRDEADLSKLAELEHIRWSLDRRLEGWRPGKKTDRAQRIHADLRPYNELSDSTKQYDVNMILELDSWLETAPDGLRRFGDAPEKPEPQDTQSLVPKNKAGLM